MSTYVYGITRASGTELPEQLTGVGQRRVRAVEESGLAAIVSDAPEELTPKRKELLAHQDVLGHAGAGRTVLPMRFGSVSDDDGAVSQVLAERADHFRERLDALENTVEYNVKATHDEEAVLHRVLADDPALRAASEANRASGGGTYDERLRFGEQVANAVKEREAEDARLLHETLQPLADDVSPGPESTGWLANYSFLVDRETVARFVNTLDEFQKAQPHLELRVSGPLPPYSFVG
ncbi:GvpL/GvpF family gas vesicle protein [Streptomyces sp. NPDC048172]|uniref:GvpL/GvpF family gas vesicle protein n=1 Tax=Streptomyces sp. NPDC048172 TaxID=3365505 RepID=UPI003711F791